MTRNAANTAFARHVQARLGVTVDGWAGTKTRAAFDAALPPEGHADAEEKPVPQIASVNLDQAKFFSAVRQSLFGGRLTSDQVNGMTGILAAFDTVGDGMPDTLAYAMATAYHETGRRMVPVREGFATTDAGARRAVNALAARRGANSAVARYARPQPPYGHVYYGRGHVQLTWLENYERSSLDAGIDLVKHPDAMLDPVVSALILIVGLLDGRWNGRGHGLRHYLDRGDCREARRTVNILDKADEIADQAQRFLAAIRAAQQE
jgi:hypothetical protein